MIALYDDLSQERTFVRHLERHCWIAPPRCFLPNYRFRDVYPPATSANTEPHAMDSAEKAGDFTGKTVVLFATSGGIGFGNTTKDLQSSAPAADIREGRLLKGRSSAASLKNMKMVDS